MSIVLPRLRREPKPRKTNRVETKLARTEAHLAAVQEDNARLLNMKAAADDHFMVMHQLVNDLEADVRRLRADLAAAQGAYAVAAADIEARNRWIADLERQAAELRQRLDVSTFAEAAAARTQEIDVRSLQERFATGPVVALHEAPIASVDPKHVPAPVAHT